MIECFLGDALGVLSSPFWRTVTVLQCGTHLKLLDRVVSGACFLLGMCLSVTLHIVNLWQYNVCCTVYKLSSGVTRCRLFMVLYICHMCQCGLHAVLWSYLGVLMRLLAVKPRSTAGLLFPSQCLCGTKDSQVSRAGLMLFHWPSCSLTFCLLLISHSFLSLYRLVLSGYDLRTDWV